MGIDPVQAGALASLNGYSYLLHPSIELLLDSAEEGCHLYRLIFAALIPGFKQQSPNSAINLVIDTSDANRSYYPWYKRWKMPYWSHRESFYLNIHYGARAYVHDWEVPFVEVDLADLRGGLGVWLLRARRGLTEQFAANSAVSGQPMSPDRKTLQLQLLWTLKSRILNLLPKPSTALDRKHLPISSRNSYGSAKTTTSSVRRRKRELHDCPHVSSTLDRKMDHNILFFLLFQATKRATM